MNDEHGKVKTAASGDLSDIFTKKASFIQHSLPGLAPGRYQIQARQSLAKSESATSQNLTGGLPSLTRKFGVTAPSFVLSQNAIHSVFPPANSAGDFSTSLPHVVFTSEKLPWLRSPYTPLNVPEARVHSYEVTIDGATRLVEYDNNHASWLAVLLVSPSDWNHADPSRQVQQGTLLDLIPASLHSTDSNGQRISGRLPAEGYSAFSYFLEPQYASQATEPVDLGIGQTASDPVQYLDLPCSLFNAIGPSLDDLKMMAHVRAVQMEHKPIPSDQIANQEERYSLVIGNRLPESQPESSGNSTTAPPGTNVALLVSLENLEFALSGRQTGSYYDTTISSSPNGFVRVVVLHLWRFTSWQDTSFEFETLLKSLNGRDAKGPNISLTVPNSQLRMPNVPVFAGDDDRQKIVQEMLASGFLPFTHVSRMPLSAENPAPITTASWYRGPLIPYGAFVPQINFLENAGLDAVPANYSSDQLLRFDPNVGMYDVSYAIAWQLGRLLALSNKEFSVALYRWKKQVSVQYRTALEQAALSKWYSGLLELSPASASARNVGIKLRDALVRHLATNTGKWRSGQ